MTRPLRKKILAHLQDPSANGSTIGGKLQQRKRRRDTLGAWSSLLFVFIVLTVCVAPNIFQGLPKITPGTVWEFDNLTTPYDLEVPDPEATELHQRRLQENHVKIFNFNSELEDEILLHVGQLFTDLRNTEYATDTAALRKNVRQRWGLDLPEDSLATLAEQANTSRTLTDLDTIFHHLLQVRRITPDKSLLTAALRSNRALIVSSGGQKITSSTLRQTLSYPDETFNYLNNAYLSTFQVPANVRKAYGDLARQLIKPNLVYNQEETERRLQSALSGIEVRRKLDAGSTVIHRGETANGMIVAALDQLSSRERQNDLLRILGNAIIVLMCMAFTTLYAGRFNRDLSFNSRSVLMVALPIVFAVSLGRVIINLGGGFLFGAFALPAGMVGILTVMLFDERFAIVLTTMACALFSVATGLLFPYTLIGLAGGYTAIASLRNLQERREVLFTGIYVAIANCLMALAISLILSPSRPDFQAGLLAAVINGIVCYVLAVGALPVFENLFQITTDVRLLELTGANHKLLQLMEEKAPGSLHHSMNVASLAEAAAEAVGAHYLLVRAGAYFHDVGKLLKPMYFTENQSTPEQKQIHSKLSPAMSTLIIKNHVKEGVELARSYRIPERVIDFIPEHHGTGLIKFFYVQALKKAEIDGSDEIISEEEYRYPGPKPRSVETAILMLADSVDAIATSRFTGKSPDETEIRRAVHDAVTDKYEDRQLNNSPLTFQDLEIIKEAFVKGLQNRFHQRVKYPALPASASAAARATAVRRDTAKIQLPVSTVEESPSGQTRRKP